VPNTHEPIVSKDMFDLARSIKYRRREHDMNQSSYNFAFSTVVKCGQCGRSYHGKLKTKGKWTQIRNYRCSGKYRQDSCDASDVSEHKLTDLFLSWSEYIEIENDEPNKVIGGKDTAKEKKRLEKLIADSAIRRKNYSRAMADGKMAYEIFSELMDEENEKVTNWQKELDEILQQSPERKRTRRENLSLLNSLRSNWHTLTEQERKVSLNRLISALVIKKMPEGWQIVAYVFGD
jgi:site-specific DNA recombinase